MQKMMNIIQLIKDGTIDRAELVKRLTNEFIMVMNFPAWHLNVIKVLVGIAQNAGIGLGEFVFERGGKVYSIIGWIFVRYPHYSLDRKHLEWCVDEDGIPVQKGQPYHTIVAEYLLPTLQLFVEWALKSGWKEGADGVSIMSAAVESQHYEMVSTLIWKAESLGLKMPELEWNEHNKGSNDAKQQERFRRLYKSRQAAVKLF